MTPIDLLWLLTATLLVFVMQAGFACFEAGLVRAKNTINVVMKNLLDIAVVAVLFWLVGFGLMFGASAGGWIGADGFAPDAQADPQRALFFVFQLMFCATAATIVSGAVAERMTLAGYLLASAVIAVVVYPVFGHWAWGGTGAERGWLAAEGFVDFAGSTVVHSIGGWCALALLLVIGPRAGRFDGAPIEPHSLLFTNLGVMLLWFGWFGFNAGSALRFDDSVPVIVLNTLLAPVAGVLALLAHDRVRGRPVNVPKALNAVIGGLVAITAGCHAVGAAEALLIGAVGGLCVAFGAWLLDRWRIDDAVGAAPAHLFAGVWGTLAVGLFGDPAILGTGLDRSAQIAVQALGALTAGLFAFGVMAPLMWFAHRTWGLRVSPRAEAIGLNIAEHGASTALQTLIADMEQTKATGDFRRMAEIEEGGEYALVAAKYNQVLERVRREVGQREAAIRALDEARRSAEDAARAKSRFLAHMSHELRTPLNAIIGFSDLIAAAPAADGAKPQHAGYASAIGDSGRHLLRVINDILEYSRVDSDAIALQEAPFSIDALTHSVARMLSPLADQRTVALSVVLNTPVDVVFGDEKLIKQALINVASNALKFTPTNGSVRIVVDREFDGRLAIAVSDDGPGIAPEDYEKALQPFGQTGDVMTRRAQEGTGLGLPLAQSFIKLHGGTLTLSPARPTGLTVTLRLPASRVIEPPAEPGAAT